MSSFYLELGALVSGARNRRRLTQSELAAAVGLSRSSIANIEKGRQPVQVHLLVEMAKVLCVAPTELLPGQASAQLSVESKAAEAMHRQEIRPELIQRAMAHLVPTIKR